MQSISKMGKGKQEDFKEFLELKGELPNTIEQYIKLQSWLPSEISQGSINRFIREHNYPKTRSFLRLYLFKFLKIDEKKIIIEKYSTTKERLITIVTFDEFKNLVDASDLEMQTALRILWDTGLRASELISLTPARINFEAMQVSGIGKRNIPFYRNIKPTTAQLLKEYIKKIKLEKNDKIFDMTRQTLYNKINNLGKDVLEKDIGVHTIRHSKATYLIRKGYDIGKVQRFLRHKRLETTEVYIKTTEKDIEDMDKDDY